eukprot:Hpha_TRINITY_DN16222_c1_g2::TRINITY_DN16222_c1_g2_i1::g.11250::m.11250
MGNCTSSDVKSQALDAQRVQGAQPVKRELKDMFDVKKDEGVEEVHKAVRELEDAVDAAPEAVDDAPGDAVEEKEAEAVADAADAAESSDGSGSARHQGIAALRRLSPSSSGLSLLQAAGEMPVEEEAQAVSDDVDAGGDAAGDVEEEAEKEVQEELDAAGDAAADAAVDAVDDAPRRNFASNLVVDTDAEPQAVGASTTRDLQCGSPASPSSPASPAAWVPDESTKTCQCCGLNFNFVRRRHHCRACGQVVCNSCSVSRKVVLDMGHTRPVRCCDNCVQAES